MKTFFYAAALLAALPAQALAQQPGADLRGPEVRVAHADLNLRSAAGIETLDRRLSRAVSAVCGDAEARWDLATKIAARRCIAAKAAELAPQRDRVVAAQAGTATLAARVR